MLYTLHLEVDSNSVNNTITTYTLSIVYQGVNICQQSFTNRDVTCLVLVSSTCQYYLCPCYFRYISDYWMLSLILPSQTTSVIQCAICDNDKNNKQAGQWGSRMMKVLYQALLYNVPFQQQYWTAHSSLKHQGPGHQEVYAISCYY